MHTHTGGVTPKQRHHHTLLGPAGTEKVTLQTLTIKATYSNQALIYNNKESNFHFKTLNVELKLAVGRHMIGRNQSGIVNCREPIRDSEPQGTNQG